MRQRPPSRRKVAWNPTGSRWMRRVLGFLNT
jgi:hypothetical protein